MIHATEHSCGRICPICASTGRRPGAVPSLDHYLEELVTWMALAEPEKPDLDVQLSYFDGAMPMTEGAEILDSASATPVLFPLGARPRDLSSRIDQVIIGDLCDDDDRRKIVGWSLSRVREVVGRRALRGRVDGRFLGGPIYEIALAMVHSGGRYFGGRVGLFAETGGRLVQLGPVTTPLSPAGGDDQHIIGRFKISAAVQFTREISWVVELGYLGHPHVQFMTDPAGAAAAFRLRDIPNGRSRRAAIIHWVREHWRTSRTDGERRPVARHLRGAEAFIWNGLSCRITPSAADLRAAGRR